MKGAGVMDLSTATPDELDQIEAAVKAERIRRQNQGLVEKRVHDVLAEARAGGVAPTPVPGAAWVQPTMAADAYMAGDIVTHEGVRWVSTHDVNVHAPGVSGWREVTEDGTLGEYRQPTGQHDAYRVGDVVRFEGSMWRSVIDWNAWSPAAYPRGWEKVAEAPEPEPEPDEDETSEPEPLPDEPDSDEEPAPAPDVPDFQAPTGAHDTYSQGDRVRFQGRVYESVIANNSWSPQDYPAGWRAVDDA